MPNEEIAVVAETNALEPTPQTLLSLRAPPLLWHIHPCGRCLKSQYRFVQRFHLGLDVLKKFENNSLS